MRPARPCPFPAAPLLCLAIVLIAPRVAAADPISWNNAAGGNWNTAANWSPAQVPTGADDVTIDLPGTYTVTIDVNATVASLALGGASGTQTLAASFHTITVNGPFVVSANGAFDFSTCTVNGTGSLTHSGGSSRLLTTTVALPIVNNTALRVQRTCAMNGAYTSGSGSTLRLESELGSTAVLTIASSWTNNGTLELTTISNAGSASLTTSGTLTNAAGATILISPGTGGTRTMTGALSNAGTVTVNTATTLAGAGADHVNGALGLIDVAGGNLTITQSGTTPSFTDSGSISVAAGRTLSVSGGEFVHIGPMTGAGTFALTNVTLTQNADYVTGALPISLTTSTVNGPGTFRNSSGVSTLIFGTSVVNSALVNDGTLHAQRTCTFNGAYTSGSGSTLRIESELGASAVLTVASGWTNNGTLELTTLNNAGSASLTTAGTLTNAVGATILITPGTGGTRTMTGALSNSGTVTISAALTLAGANADHVNTGGGVIDLDGANLTITQTGVTPSFTNDGTITVPAGRTLTVTGGELVHSGSLSGGGTLVLTNVTLTQNADYVTGVLPISLTTSTVNGPGTFHNSTGANTLMSTTCVVNSALVNDGTLHVQRTCTWNGAYTSGSGSAVRIESELGANAVLTVASGWTNNGTLELTTISNAGNASLTTSGTLTNAAGATILISPGTGGSRTMTGALSNSGTVTVNTATTLAGAGADHVNGALGLIDVAAGNLTITQSGTTPSFTDSGSVSVAAGRTLSVSGGEFVHIGAMAGAGTFAISSVTLTQDADYVTNTLPISLTTSTVNGPGTFRNSSGVNTLMLNCIVNSALVNDGTLRVQRTCAWNGAYTLGSGSTVRIESELGANAVLTVASGWTNNGTLELTNISNAGSATLAITSGALTNPVGSVVLCSAGTGGSRFLTCPLLNAGTVTIGGPTTLASASADHVNAGTGLIDVTGGGLTITQSVTTPSFTNDGTIHVTGANITVNSSGTTPKFVNNGTITVSSGRTLAVSGCEFVHTGSLTGTGLLSLSTATLTQNVDYLTSALPASLTSTTVNGPGTFRSSTGTSTLMNTCTVNSALVNDGTLHVQRASTWNAGCVSGSGSTVRIESELGANAALTIAGGWTNNGALELTNLSNAGSASLIAGSNALTNAAGATILVSAGTGGARTLTGTLSNAGTVTINTATTLAGAGADHVNAATGVVDLVGGNLTITQTGTTPSFTSSGVVSVGAGRTLTVTGGTFASLAGATIRGNGTLNLSGTTFTNGGHIAPGASPGSLTITGPCPVDATGGIDIELGGITAGTEYDRLTVSGALTQSAPIHISLVNGFVPMPGQTFQILNYGSITQNAAPLYTGLEVGGGVALLPQVSGTHLTLLAVGQTWRRLFPPGASPAARERHTAVYNPTSNRMIVFGGLSDAGPRNDVWVLSNADGQAGIPSWQKLTPGGGPPSARAGHSAVYDDANNVLMVFGGDNAAVTPVTNSEVWVLSNADGTGGTPSWTQLAPSGDPPAARTGQSAVYDPSSNQMIVFGGDDQPPCGPGLNDVWVLSNANGSGGAPVWSQLVPAGTPPTPRARGLATYDAATNRMTLISGVAACAAGNQEMWVLADANGIGSPTWSASAPTGTPPSPWSLQSGIYDPATNRVTLFGGRVAGADTNLVRTMIDGNGVGAPQWVDLTPTGTTPAARFGHSAVQANGHRMAIFGGSSAAGRLADVWVLEETQAHVTGVTPPDDAPRAWVTGFSRPPAPNPARGVMRFAITLAHAEAVDLAITDVAGRRVATLHHGALDAGEHAFAWAGATAAGAPAPAGLYLLSFSAEGRREVKKFVVTR